MSTNPSRVRSTGNLAYRLGNTHTIARVRRERMPINPKYPYVDYGWETVFVNPNPELDGNLDVCQDSLHKGPPFKEGGDLKIMHLYADDSKVGGENTHMGDSAPLYNPPRYFMRYTWQGGFSPNWRCAVEAGKDLTAHLRSYPSSGKYSGTYGDPSQAGPTAWNRFKPKLSQADLGIFTGEFREVPRMLKTTGKVYADYWRRHGGKLKPWDANPKKLADQYLNVQFGWTPFVNDLRKFLKLVGTAEKRIAQSARDNGQWIRRKGTLSTTAIDEEISRAKPTTLYKYVSPVIYQNNLYVRGGLTDCNQFAELYASLKSTYTFSGAFKYWVPSLIKTDNGFNKVKNYLDLYGARANPLLVWNLTPWSWLIDWTTNVGDNISNLCSISEDRLVAKYAYIMQELEDTTTIKHRITFRDGTKDSCEWSRGCTSKQRKSASPFGFSIDPGTFSERQWSILVALGFSKLSL